MHGARLGITEKETGMREHSKEIGDRRRYWVLGQRSSEKPMDTEEANDTDKHTRKRFFISLFRAKCNSYGTGPAESTGDELKP